MPGNFICGKWQKNLDLPPGGGYTVESERGEMPMKINEVEAQVGITKKSCAGP